MKRNIVISLLLALVFYVCIRINVVAFDENSLLTIATIYLGLVAVFETIRLFDFTRNMAVRGNFHFSNLFTISVMIINLFVLYIINKDEIFSLLWIIDYVAIGMISVIFSLSFVVKLSFKKEVI